MNFASHPPADPTPTEHLGLVPAAPVCLEAQACPIALPRASDPGIQIWRDSADVICAYSHLHEGWCWLHVPGLASFRFATDAPEVRAFAYSDAPRERVVDKYRRTVVPLILQVMGREVLHASAISTKRGLVGFCGPSGAGKTTLAYGLGTRGWPLWSDDTMIFDAAGEDCRAVPMPFDCRLRPTAAAYFGDAATVPRLNPDWAGVDRITSEQPPVSALFALRPLSPHSKTGAEPALVAAPLATPQAFARIIAHANCFDLQRPDRMRRTVEFYLAMTASVPVHDLPYSPDFERMPALLDAVEAMLD